jgi:hypothetical protein
MKLLICFNRTSVYILNTQHGYNKVQSLAIIDLSLAQTQLSSTPKVLAALISTEQAEAPLMPSVAP